MALSAEDRRKLRAVKAGGDKDRLLGFGLDLNAIQGALEPVKRGEEQLVGESEGFRHAENLARNALRLPVDAVQAFNSPIDTGTNILKVLGGLTLELMGPGSRLLDPITGQIGEESREAFKEVKRGAVDQMTNLETILERPLDFLTNLFSGGGKVLLKKGSKARKFASDPGQELLKGGVKGVVDVEKRALAKANELRPKPVDNLVNRAGGSDAVGGTLRKGGSEVADQALGFSTSTGATVQEIVRTAPERGTSRLVKEFSGPVLGGREVKQAKRAELLKIGLEAVDQVKKNVDDFQAGVNIALGPDFDRIIDPKLFERLKRDAAKIFTSEGVGGQLSDQFKMTTTQTPLNVVPSQRGITPSGVFPGGRKSATTRSRTGKAKAGFGEALTPGSSPITTQGPSRSILIQRVEEILNAGRTDVRSLQNLMFDIDAQIDVLNSDLGKRARAGLVQFRQKLRKTLGDELGEVYDNATAEWEASRIHLKQAKNDLGLEPGKVNARGGIDVDFREGTMTKFLGALDDADKFAFATLQELERRSGVTGIIDRAAGVQTQSLLGTGLVVKSEISQNARGAIGRLKSLPTVVRRGGLVGGLSSAIFGLPIGITMGLLSSVVFSPKLMQRVMLDVPPKLRPKMQAFFDWSRKTLEQASGSGVPVSQWIQNGVTLEQALQRLARADPGPSQEEPQQRTPTQSFLGRIGSGDTTLIGNRLER
jgi:hypothetical protein